jgi:hypothetical protein
MFSLRFRGAARAASLAACLMTTGLLTACGGGQDPTGTSGAQGRSQTDAPAASGSAQSSLARGAQLNQRSLALAEEQAAAADAAPTQSSLAELPPGQIAPKSAYRSGDVARKAAASRIPAYRFFNTATGAHFYTTDETERSNVQNNLSPPFSFDGPAFSVASAFSPGLSPVHRFYNSQSGVHFYTISDEERANVVANLPQFVYEGVAYHASQVAGLGLTPLYRFYAPSRGFHFYTASPAERDNLINNLSATYSYEHIGYYVLASDWRAEKLPHTGITASQCYQGGNNTLLACSDAAATSLNPQQDGHRAGINPMRYSTEPSLFGPYPITSCVRDNVTGLLWEGKTVAGERAGNNTYTNLGDSAPTDASGYVAAVNAAELCGFTDWRLPTRQELLTLVDYGKTSGAPINTTFFPNTAQADAWSADGVSGETTRAWRVSFFSGDGSSGGNTRSFSLTVRLVRGSAASGPRYSFSSVVYSASGQADAANNMVNDAWTGLQWRRCEEGRVWNGSACTGSASAFSHQQALDHARNRSGWRLPNVKELSSLVDLSVSGSATRVNPVAFPGAAAEFTWSSSPSVVATSRAWVVLFGNGVVSESYVRSSPFAVRLVRASP